MSGEIAIIGMAGRFPGAPDLGAYWELLANGREGLVRLDRDELLAAGVSPAVMADPRYVPAAGALAAIDRFDAAFWGIGAHEAALMDPQQRIALEVAWHALEDAAIDPRRNEGAIGVFVGAAISTYLLFQLREQISGPSAPSQLLAMIGNDKDYIATQLAYRLDLRGPAIAVQTACSSSLVAVHLACQSLASGECDIALAGGVSVRVPHRVGYLHEAGGMLSADGHCRSFAEGADGTVFGSGSGIVVLRRLEDAAGDRVRAVVLGSAVNNDGNRKIGFTAPSQDQQTAVIAEAVGVAGISASEVGYVEGHGTGTGLGDPLEVMALSEAFRGAAPGSVALGSAKSNIGHTETAAGIAGLIKTVLMLEHRTIVPTLHAACPSPRIPWAETPFALAREARRWEERLVAGVSSFGIGGTNAHVVIGAAPAARAPARMRLPRLVVSAQSREALAALQAEYQSRCDARPEDFAAICAAVARRPRLAWWLMADSPAALAAAAMHDGPWPEMFEVSEGPPLDLPLYPFRRERHWLDAAADTGLLGAAVATPFEATLYPVALAPQRAWLMQHVVRGTTLLPGALHVALLAEAAGGAVSDVTLRLPHRLEDAEELQVWRAADGGLRVMAQHDGDWLCLAEARTADPGPPPAAWSIGDGEAIDGAAWAARMAAAGLDFGPAFRLIARLRRDANQVRAELDPAAMTNQATVLDAGLQAFGAAAGDAEGGFLPAQVARFAQHGNLTAVRTILARLDGDMADAKSGGVLWLDGTGGVVAEADGIVCRRARGAAADMLYRLAWRADLDRAAIAPYPALEAIARSFARRAMAAVPQPARPALAALLETHAARDADAPADPEEAARALAARHPEHSAEIALVMRCGAGLADVLAGHRDPLELLFAGDGPAADAYRLSPLAREMNRMAAAVAAAAKPRRVIEIGGGTAATTLALRAALPGLTQYLFTDISPAFFAAAERQFGRGSVFSAAVFDIARDPAAQGIAVGAWDLVVAANVLHATPDLAAALRHACRLLAPGGRLLLIEGTERSARLDITFGMTDGWSRRTDRDLRPDYPLLASAAWRQLLRAAGLHDPLVVAEPGGQAVLTATASPSRWLAVGHDERLAGRLGLRFLPVGERLPAEPIDGVVVLAGIEHGANPLRDLLAVSRAVLERPEGPRLLVPTQAGEAVFPGDRPDPEKAALGGFLRSLAREHPRLRARAVDLGEDADLVAAVALERALDDGEDRSAWRDGERLLARLERLAATRPPPPSLRLMPDLSLQPAEMPQAGPGEVVVRVRAAGINYKDALTAAGQLPPAGDGLVGGLGGECAGEIAAIGPGVAGLAIGDAVVAVAGGALASHVAADARLVLPKPPTLDFVQAAGVPIAGVTAWYALRHLVRIAAGMRVLVHSATGGVGGFALRLALAAGAELVATAGSEAKRALLAALGVREVHSSRGTDFAAAAPVDIVLSALPREGREAGLRLLRPGGHFIEIGRIGVPSAAEIAALRPDIAYHVVALDRVEAPFFAALLGEVLAAVAADPSLLPPVTPLRLEEAPDAFAAMMRATHVGKLVAMPALPPAIHGDGSYLVTGGLGGLGPEIAAWLERRGAGGVLVVARHLPDGGLPAGIDRRHVVIGDVADPATLQAVDQRARALGLPPVRGVVHAAGILEDALVARLDPASFDRVMRPKLHGVRAILDHWRDLDFLVGFSSAGALFGSAGQAAHTAASAAMDAALVRAAKDGRPAVAVDWGAWAERGAAAERRVGASLAAGMGSIATADGFAALDHILATSTALAAVLPVDWPAMRAAGAAPALLRDLAGDDGGVAVSEPAAPPAVPAAEAALPVRRREWLRERITAECARMLAIRGAIEPRRPLQELGLDSLAALELRNRLGRLVGAVLPAGLLFDYPTIAALTEHLATAHFGLAPAAAPVAPVEAGPAEEALAEDAFAGASDAELDAALAAFAALHGEAEP